MTSPWATTTAEAAAYLGLGYEQLLDLRAATAEAKGLPRAWVDLGQGGRAVYRWRHDRLDDWFEASGVWLQSRRRPAQLGHLERSPRPDVEASPSARRAARGSVVGTTKFLLT